MSPTATLSPPTPTTKIRVGIIGCGQVAQVIHIPTLGFLSDYYTITYLCDVSHQSLLHSQSKIPSAPSITKNPEELCASENVDVVFVLSSDEYHADQAELALKHDKFVLIEKPVALNLRDIDRLQEAEKRSKGKVMVGYMRRYASVFEDAVREIGGLDKILYARVRDIIGQNSTFVDQSGTFPKAFSDIDLGDAKDRSQRAADLVHQALHTECGVPVTESNTLMWRYLSGLGTHDLSAMREALGMPESVLGVSLGVPFWNVLFRYPTFTLSYESGIHSIPTFDAHIEIYSPHKSIRIQYDTPYVKGLPITLHIAENVNGSLKQTTIRKTYEDAYTQELLRLYGLVARGEEVKTTLGDARRDAEILGMVLRAGNK